MSYTVFQITVAALARLNPSSSSKIYSPFLSPMLLALSIQLFSYSLNNIITMADLQTNVSVSITSGTHAPKDGEPRVFGIVMGVTRCYVDVRMEGSTKSVRIRHGSVTIVPHRQDESVAVEDEEDVSVSEQLTSLLMKLTLVTEEMHQGTQRHLRNAQDLRLYSSIKGFDSLLLTANLFFLRIFSSNQIVCGSWKIASTGRLPSRHLHWQRH
jgi:hypothetical protein